MKQKRVAAAWLGLAATTGALAFPIYEGAGFAIPDNNPVGASSTIVIPTSIPSAWSGSNWSGCPIPGRAI